MRCTKRTAQGLLFVAKSVRGIGLGRWLVEEAVRLFRFVRFQWDLPLDGDGFGPSYSDLSIGRICESEERFVEGWGQRNTEVRFDLAFGSC
jgi:hypothetical protein